MFRAIEPATVCDLAYTIRGGLQQIVRMLQPEREQVLIRVHLGYLPEDPVKVEGTNIGGRSKIIQADRLHKMLLKV